MNILIFVGLLVLGVLALAGAITLMRGEPAAARVTASPSAPANSEQQQALATSTLPAAPQEASTTTSPAQAAAKPSVEQETSAYSFVAENRPPLNGQFHELTSELHTLQQQASNLKQRLTMLIAIADRLEADGHEQAIAEEEHQIAQ